MTDINTVTLIGRLTAGAEIKYITKGTPCVNFSMAVNENKKDPAGNRTEYANFFDVVLWGNLAEVLNPYLTKGRQVCVSGRLHQDRWEKDGKRFSKVGIVADSVQLIGGKNDGGKQADGGSAAGFSEDIPF